MDRALTIGLLAARRPLSPALPDSRCNRQAAASIYRQGTTEAFARRAGFAVTTLIQESLAGATRIEAMKPKDLARVVVDTTVQPKVAPGHASTGHPIQHTVRYKRPIAAWTLRRNGTNFPIPLSIAAPPPALGLGDPCTTGLGLRTCRFATVEAAPFLARLRSDLATGAGPSSGSTKAPALATAWRCLVRCRFRNSVKAAKQAYEEAYCPLSCCSNTRAPFRSN